jgi:hypothetical protein
VPRTFHVAALATHSSFLLSAGLAAHSPRKRDHVSNKLTYYSIRGGIISFLSACVVFSRVRRKANTRQRRVSEPFPLHVIRRMRARAIPRRIASSFEKPVRAIDRLWRRIDNIFRFEPFACSRTAQATW